MRWRCSSSDGFGALGVLDDLLDQLAPRVGRFGHVVVKLLAQGEGRFEVLGGAGEGVAVRPDLGLAELELGEADLVLGVSDGLVGGDQEGARLPLKLLGLSARTPRRTGAGAVGSETVFQSQRPPTTRAARARIGSRLRPEPSPPGWLAVPLEASAIPPAAAGDRAGEVAACQQRLDAVGEDRLKLAVGQAVAQQRAAPEGVAAIGHGDDEQGIVAAERASLGDLVGVLGDGQAPGRIDEEDEKLDVLPLAEVGEGGIDLGPTA